MTERGFSWLLDATLEQSMMDVTGYCKISTKQPPEAMVKAIENAIGEQLYQDIPGGDVTRHFEGDYDDELWKACNAFIAYDLNLTFINQAFLDITSADADQEQPRVVRRQKSKGKPKPLMVGPRNKGAKTTVVLIRPLRNRLDTACGFPSVYDGSYQLKPSEVNRSSPKLQEEEVTVELNEVLVIWSTEWWQFLDHLSGEDAIFVCKAYKVGWHDPVDQTDEPGFVPDEIVTPYMRLDRELSYRYRIR